jgi:hypothetical protein
MKGNQLRCVIPITFAGSRITAFQECNAALQRVLHSIKTRARKPAPVSAHWSGDCHSHNVAIAMLAIEAVFATHRLSA